MEWFITITNFIVDIAWPSLVAFLAVYYREEFRSLLRKASFKMNVGQAQLEINEQSNQGNGASVEETILSLSKQDISDLLPPELKENYPIIELETKRIRDFLDNERQTNPDENTPEEVINRLIVNSAKLDFRRWCERTIQVIYPEQVKLLVEIETKGPFTLEDTQAFYEDVRLNNLSMYKKIPFESFIQYLINEGLIISDAGRYKLQPLGKSYLSWTKENIENQ